jgi:Domain of unknown function (DUF4167)
MQNGRKTNMNMRQSRPAGSPGRSQRWVSNAPRPAPQGSHNARRNYDRYMALAQAELQAGDRVAAENYYQHAEHYFRLISSDGGAR